MESKSTDWRPGNTVCRCCLTEGCYKDISTEYFWMGKREVYSEMLTETFDLNIAFSKSGGPNSNSRLICEPCISRLRDASDFKRQVQECERTFMQFLDPGSSGVMTEVELDKEVKIEAVKLEEASDEDLFDDRDFGTMDDDDDDDLDDQPLTKLASKIPKKESVDIMELLDSAKVGDKRKASTKLKVSPTKKVSSRIIKITGKEVKVKNKKLLVKATTSSKEPKATVSKLTVKPEKKKKENENEEKLERGQKARTSIWEMTAAERRNVAEILVSTTVKPFFFCRYYFKCFFCREHFPEINALLQHSSSHEMPDKEKVLKELLTKGTKALKVDISEMKCKICNTEFTDLKKIRQHLIDDHKKYFSESEAGIVVFNLELKNGQVGCHICSKLFPTFISLNRHMNVHFKNYVCETCGAGFMTNQRLLQHKEIHLPGGFPCTKCSKVFTTNCNLKYHFENQHEGTTKLRLLRCPHCSERFKEHFRKLKHLKEVHNITFTFECDICKAIFTSRRTLREHTNINHSQKTECVVCKRRFTSGSTLRKHMVTHTGERNYVCNLCPKTYRQQKSLKQHLKVHMNETNTVKLTCPECGNGFSGKNEFHKHIKDWHPRSYLNYLSH